MGRRQPFGGGVQRVVALGEAEPDDGRDRVVGVEGGDGDGGDAVLRHQPLAEAAIFQRHA